MSRLNDLNNYAGRVRYAAAVVAAGREATRAFDNCFENIDGSEVAAALVRRAEKNPKIAKNLPKYLAIEHARACAERLKGVNLAKSSRETIARHLAERQKA